MKKILLSVIVPAYNEKKTFSILIKKLLKVRIRNVKLEIIIVESNSTDGTREEAIKFQNYKNIKLILQKEAKGKGNAVIKGFEYVKGEFVIIQDSDLEYNPKNFNCMLKPIINGESNFVLGSRIKKGILNMRSFENRKALSLLFNILHVILTSIFNIVYQKYILDPWTCYRLFPSYCLKKIKFQRQGFDFDTELICKLIRFGLKPKEIPIDYKSRSFDDGKKINVIKDGYLAITAILRYRFF
jgi:glycosyltransferase involved in cell wall biosynthesis